MKYKYVREKLHTGDIVLFSGRGMFSTMIRLFTRSQWSHVGMVVRFREHNRLMIYESTTMNKMSKIRGVQLSGLYDRIRTYNGIVKIGRLMYADTVAGLNLEIKVRLSPILSEYMAEHKNKPYEKSLMQLFKAAYDGWFGENTADMSSVFCSELICGIYQRWGLVSEKRAANEMTPADFDGNVNLTLYTCGEVELGVLFDVEI